MTTLAIAHLPKERGVLLLRGPNDTVVDLNMVANVYKKASRVAVALREGTYADADLQAAFTAAPEAFSFDWQEPVTGDHIEEDEDGLPAIPLAGQGSLAAELAVIETAVEAPAAALATTTAAITDAVAAASAEMQQALAIIARLGYRPEQLKTTRGQAWRDLVAAATDERVRDCIQAWRWCAGSLDKLYAARKAQALKRAAAGA